VANKRKLYLEFAVDAERAEAAARRVAERKAAEAAAAASAAALAADSAKETPAGPAAKEEGQT
jgi:hypothetical protein